MGHGGVKHRPLVVADVPRIGELFTEHTGRKPDLATFEGWIEHHPSTGVEIGGQLVGFVVTCRFAPDVLEVTNVLVTPGHRGEGLARAMFAAVEADAVTRGYRSVIVAPSQLNVTVGERADAATFYERLGFRVVHDTPDTVIVVKSLDGG